MCHISNKTAKHNKHVICRVKITNFMTHTLCTARSSSVPLCEVLVLHLTPPGLRPTSPIFCFAKSRGGLFASTAIVCAFQVSLCHGVSVLHLTPPGLRPTSPIFCYAKSRVSSPKIGLLKIKQNLGLWL